MNQEENMAEKNIAEKIREDLRPEGEMFALRAEARRLRNSLAVAEKWLEVAEEEDETGLLTAKAEYTRDQLEEELSRVAFGMEVLRRQKELRHARPVEDPDRTARAACSRTLCSALTAPCETRRRRPLARRRRRGTGTPPWGAHGCHGCRQHGDGAVRGGTASLAANDTGPGLGRPRSLLMRGCRDG
jgi:hypothetical protein